MTDWSGHVCVQQSKDEDAAGRLGEEDWAQYFNVVSVNLDVWEALEALGFWDGINAQCDVLVDLYEEEWVNMDCLEDLQKEIQAYLVKYKDLNSGYPAVDGQVLEFLRSISVLANTARQRNVPLIFAF